MFGNHCRGNLRTPTPPSLCTYEPQWGSDVFGMYQSRLRGQPWVLMHENIHSRYPLVRSSALWYPQAQNKGRALVISVSVPVPPSVASAALSNFQGLSTLNPQLSTTPDAISGNWRITVSFFSALKTSQNLTKPHKTSQNLKPVIFSALAPFTRLASAPPQYGLL